jgi:uncharacterized protein YraI
MALRRIKHIPAQSRRRVLPFHNAPQYSSLISGRLPGYSQKHKSRRNLVTCLTITGLVLLSGAALAGLIGVVVGVALWSSANPVARLPLQPNAVRFHLPTLTPTPTPMPTGMPAQGVIATATPPLSGSYQTVAAMAAAAQMAAATPAATPPSAFARFTGPVMLTALVGLNVRTGPGLDYPVIGRLAAGQLAVVVVKDQTGGWWQIEYPAGDGLAWVSADPQYSTVSNDPAVAIAQAPLPSPPAGPPTATATQTPAAPPPAVSEISSSGGWSFSATRLDTIPARKLLLLYGEMINDTGAAQQISFVTGTFYNGQGQVIAADKSTYGLWPTNIVPSGGHVPFALTVYDVQDATNFNLSVKAEPVDAAPRQDFEFVTVKENWPEGLYCLTGVLKNPGSRLTDYLVIVAILYDEQGKVLRFFNTRETAVTGVVGNQTLDFETCLEAPPANIARHQLLAWGS